MDCSQHVSSCWDQDRATGCRQRSHGCVEGRCIVVQTISLGSVISDVDRGYRWLRDNRVFVLNQIGGPALGAGTEKQKSRNRCLHDHVSLYPWHFGLSSHLPW